MKIAVTAANGALGSEIISNLIKKINIDDIVALARTPSKVRVKGLKVMEGDYNIKSHFVEAFTGINTVIIISGMDHPDNRIVQHQNIIKAAVENGVRKLVYTSIIGIDGTTNFDPIVKSNRKTESDIINSGLDYAIGRNGLYIEPDIEYIDNYIREGKIVNCAGNGLCSYTTRGELAHAYTQMALDSTKNGSIYNLTGEAISQTKLTDLFNQFLGTNLIFEDIEPEKYLEIQKKRNGEFLGSVIAGIYTKIRNGEFNVKSDYQQAADKEHISWVDYLKKYPPI